MWSRSRPAPPDGPPPRYATVMKKVYPYSLRPIVIFTACLGFIWALVMGVNDLRDRGQPNASSKQQLMSLIGAILYFVVALVEAVLFVVAIMQNVAFGRVIMILAPLGVVLTLGTQVLNLVMHWSLKGDLINQCAQNTAGATYTSNAGVVQTVTADQARTICNAAWDRGTWSVIAWMIASLVLAGIFASVAMSYYRQLLDPSSVRQRRAQAEIYPLQSTYNPSNAYANNPPPPQGYQHGPPPGQQQSWMVPPYPGPPPEGTPKEFEKGDYHPEAEWANYGAPPGSPPRATQSGFGGAGLGGNQSERAQDEAWARAETSGPTAHLMGNGRSRGQGEVDGGYVVKNDEEDEAWERAKREGVTAHLTGNGPARKD